MSAGERLTPLLFALKRDEMPGLPILSGRELVRVLKKKGFRQVRQRGSHVFMQHPDGRSATVPLHPELDRGTLNSILIQCGVSREELSGGSF